LDDREGGFSGSTDEQRGIDPPHPNNQPSSSSDPQHPLLWPRLEHLRLSPDDLSRHRRSIGGSDANIILSGDRDRVRQLWLEKRGETEPADLSTNLSVMLGCWTEAFNRQWYQQLTGSSITSTGKSFVCAHYHWRRCTVDGLIEDRDAIWEAKHTSAFAKGEEVLERYMPQARRDAVFELRGEFRSCSLGAARFPLLPFRLEWQFSTHHGHSPTLFR
jgi:hypothetical protein